MKIKSIIVLALLLAAVHVSGQTNDVMQRLPNGILYKIYTKSTAPKIKLNDVITFHFIQKTDKDSVLLSSFDSGQPVKIGVQPSRNISDLMDFFPMLSEKDSALVKVPADSIFTDPEMERPPFLPKGSFLQFVIRIDQVQSMEQAMAEHQHMLDLLKTDELTALDKYVSDNKLQVLQTGSGLRYVITSPSVKAMPVAGDTVLVNYTGRTLEGKVFDSSIEAEAKKAGLEQPGRNYEPISLTVGEGQVIPGWDEGLLLLNEGSKATFLIPSDLAYGPRGAGDDIKPFSSLIFDMELVKVKPAKKEAPAPAGTAPEKPAPAEKKTPVKKSTDAPKKSTATAAKPKTAAAGSKTK